MEQYNNVPANVEAKPKVEIVERAVNLSLINDKLNYIIAKLEKA